MFSSGRKVHGICILGLGDLPELVASPLPFANKFYWDLEYLAVDCLEESLWNRTHTISSNTSAGLNFYRQMKSTGQI